MILSLDISTKCIGYCLLEDDGQFCDVGYLDIEKESGLYRKLDVFYEFICTIFADFKNVKKIYIEAPLARSNNQNVVNLLQRWNGFCCCVVYNVFNIEPILIEHRTARKLLGIKPPKGTKGKDLKKYILQHVRNYGIIPESKWKFKRTGNPKDYCFDMSDAFVIAKAGLIKDSNDG
jgi:hypothetical protein